MSYKISDDKKAKKLLQGRPFKIIYLDISDLSNVSDDVEEENILFKEDYPDFIPDRGDWIFYNENRFIINYKLYNLEENTLITFVINEKKHLDDLRKEKDGKNR